MKRELISYLSQIPFFGISEFLSWKENEQLLGLYSFALSFIVFNLFWRVFFRLKAWIIKLSVFIVMRCWVQESAEAAPPSPSASDPVITSKVNTHSSIKPRYQSLIYKSHITVCWLLHWQEPCSDITVTRGDEDHGTLDSTHFDGPLRFRGELTD